MSLCLCPYAVYCILFTIILSVMLNVIVLSVAMLSVVMLSVVMINAHTLNIAFYLLLAEVPGVARDQK